MNFNITHKTQYRYGHPVALCHNILRLRPRDFPGQACRSFRLAVSPLPESRIERLDFYGNCVTSISLQEPHVEFTITATSQVQVHPRPQLNLAGGISWEAARDMLCGSRNSLHIAAQQFLYDSPYVKRADELAEYARPSFTPGRAMLDAVMDLTMRIYNEFDFAPGATDVGTPILQVLKTRQGVCQDFAHLQIGCLRSIGIPARYVSGYIATKPPPDQPRLQGADASHAWLSAFDPITGWVDYDPTNGFIPTDQHITLAWARDYGDISPVRGMIIGGERHSLDVGVDVEPVA